MCAWCSSLLGIPTKRTVRSVPCEMHVTNDTHFQRPPRVLCEAIVEGRFRSQSGPKYATVLPLCPSAEQNTTTELMQDRSPCWKV